MDTLALAPASAGVGGAALVVPLYRCRLEQVGSRTALPDPLSAPADAAAFLRTLIPEGADRMHIVALALDAKNQVVGAYEVSVGTLAAALLSPRECLKAAILLSAAGLILGMNHVSGDPGPSLDTVTVARDIGIACDAVGIPLRDFIILGEQSFVSLVAGGRPVARARAEELLATA